MQNIDTLNSEKGRRVCRRRTICEVHRELYDLLVLDVAILDPLLSEYMVEKLEEAFQYGIKMNNKLVDNAVSTRDLFPENLKVAENLTLRKLRHAKSTMDH